MLITSLRNISSGFGGSENWLYNYFEYLFIDFEYRMFRQVTYLSHSCSVDVSNGVLITAMFVALRFGTTYCMDAFYLFIC